MAEENRTGIDINYTREISNTKFVNNYSVRFDTPVIFQQSKIIKIINSSKVNMLLLKTKKENVTKIYQ